MALNSEIVKAAALLHCINHVPSFVAIKMVAKLTLEEAIELQTELLSQLEEVIDYKSLPHYESFVKLYGSNHNIAMNDIL